MIARLEITGRLFSFPLRLLCATLVALPAGAAAVDMGEVHTFHCLHGCPRGAAETNDLIVREIYTLSSNDLTKMADWVAYRVTPQTIGPSKTRRWQADPWLDPVETLEPDDYEGASEMLDIDRGHQAPLAAFSGTANWSETNILSNITPQRKALNEGSWQQLEARETALAKRSGVAVFVLTGPLFEAMERQLPKADERHRVPSGYWKVVAVDGGGVTAFMFPQATDRRARYCDMRVSIEEVELRARLFLFPRRAEGPFTPLDAELGC